MRNVLKQLAWLAAVAAIPAILMVTASRRWDWFGVWQVFWVSALFGALIGFPATFILPRLMGRCAGLSSALRIAAFATTLFLLATLGTTLGVLILVAVGYVPQEHFGVWMLNSYRWALVLSVLVGVISYGYGSLRHQIEETNEKLRAKAAEEQHAQRLATEARLASLESRIHPHFLFNALNSVSSLIREDPTRAEKLLERVSALLRFSLYEPQGGLVRLDQELKIVRDYLEIESVRFGERLRYSIDCAPELASVSVPPLAVQTLVENSVKYAISTRRQGGEVHIRAQATADGAVVEVRDSGDGFDAASLPAGHGLDLLTSRIAAHFGQNGGLEFTRGEGVMTIRLRLPMGVTA